MMDQTSQVEWNADDQQLRYIFQIKAELIDAFEERNLETIYWKTKSLWRESDALFDSTIRKKDQIKDKEGKKEKKKQMSEREDAETKLRKIDELRVKYIKNKIHDNAEEYFIAMENYYVLICRLLAKHGAYFRKKGDGSHNPFAT